MISVIVRTRNEANWLPRLFWALSHQRRVVHEVIVVDNESNDKTVQIAETAGAKIINITQAEFTYGLSINKGIRAAKGDYIALVSGHCIPADDLWLQSMRRNFDSPEIAGVYGRQIPLPDSSDFDKRDLWTTFSVERKIQTKDFFFHNANSMISKEVWEKIPFDEKTRGVEDRIWAREAISKGYSLVYEPEAAVHHFHGIHQGRDEKRAARVVDVIQEIYKWQ